MPKKEEKTTDNALAYKLYRDPYDMDEVLFSGKLIRTIPTGFTVLVGCNGSGKSTILNSIKHHYSQNESYRIFSWDGLTDKSRSKNYALESQQFDILASLSFSSEGEEISANIGILSGMIGNFVKKSGKKNLIILLDGLDSGLSIDNIIEVKDFFKNLLIPDIEKDGYNCYVIASANEYELAKDELCIDARTGKEMHFADYEKYRNFILESRRKKDKRIAGD